MEKISGIKESVKIHLMSEQPGAYRTLQKMIERESEPLVEFVRLSSLYCGAVCNADERDGVGSQRLQSIG